MFKAIWSTLYGLLVDDGQLAVGAIIALAIAWALASTLGEAAQSTVGWLLLAMVLALVLANLYRTGRDARRHVSTAPRELFTRRPTS
jgi:hypothetical protein